MTSHHVPLAGSRRFHRGGVTILGRADPHEWCEITVKLRRKKPLPEPSSGYSAWAVKNHEGGLTNDNRGAQACAR